jgi:hypothetical protein
MKLFRERLIGQRFRSTNVTADAVPIVDFTLCQSRVPAIQEEPEKIDGGANLA